MGKQVAKTLKDLVVSTQMARVIDRSQNVDDLAATLLEHWSYDLYTRKPGPAYYENGMFKPTDLDLACFLSALADRKAVINLPHYESRRAKTKREGEIVVSNKNRHGKVMGLSANKEVFSFSVRVQDMNVITAGTGKNGEDEVGAPRNFMLVDVTGDWHKGWTQIDFMPSAKENEFLKDKKLWTDNVVVFKNFVHPNRWISFYGQYYFMTKALIQRLEEEAKFLRSEEKRLLAAGVRWPPSTDGNLKDWPKSEEGESKAITVEAFEAEIDAPWRNEFKPLNLTTSDLILNRDKIRDLQYNVLPRLRFATRATELAFSQVGAKETKMPAWFKDAKWEEGYREKGKRKDWNRLVLHQVIPGQLGFAIRYRQFKKTERVAP